MQLLIAILFCLLPTLYSGTWFNYPQTLTPPDRRAYYSGGVNQKKGYFVVTMGQGVSSIYEDVWKYDMNINQWKYQALTTNNKPQKRYSFSSELIEELEFLVVFAGYTVNGPQNDL